MKSQRGAYALVIWLDSESKITLERLGTHDFEPGSYAYLGSAFGPGGLKVRTDRHRRREKHKRWHVDTA